ncbi:MAG: hypothetical protein PVF73_10930, partial [Bacteroidales bacterium]
MRKDNQHILIPAARRSVLLLVFLLWLFAGTGAQTTIWLEDFTGLPYDRTFGDPPTEWSIDVSGGDPNVFSVQSEAFFCQANSNSGTEELIWISETIDITGNNNVHIDIDITPSFSGLEGNDYVRITYNLDGSGETQFFQEFGNFGS